MNTEKIFDAFHELSRISQKADEARRLRRAAERRCGGCVDWMKSRECPREKNVNGWSRGPSCNDNPCSKFTPNQSHLNAVAKYREAIEEKEQ